jgi:hypothetical protein
MDSGSSGDKVILELTWTADVGAIRAVNTADSAAGGEEVGKEEEGEIGEADGDAEEIAEAVCVDGDHSTAGVPSGWVEP